MADTGKHKGGVITDWLLMGTIILITAWFVGTTIYVLGRVIINIPDFVKYLWSVGLTEILKTIIQLPIGIICVIILFLPTMIEIVKKSAVLKIQNLPKSPKQPSRVLS